MAQYRNLLLFAGVALLFVMTGVLQSWNLSLNILNLALLSAIMAIGVNIQWGYAGLFSTGIAGSVALGGLAGVLIGELIRGRGGWGSGLWAYLWPRPARPGNTDQVTTYKCLVNGSLTKATEQRLAEGLTFITINRFGPTPDPIEVSFTDIEDGRWFTAGQPSASTMVLGSVPPGTAQEVREAHMNEVARFFSQTTGADLDHIMVVAADAKPDAPKQAKNRRR